MNETKQLAPPPLYDANGKAVDTKTAPAGTSLRNEFGCYFVVVKPGATTTHKAQPPEPCGPRFV